MIFIENENHTDPKLNLALEEYITRNFDTSSDYLLLYINEPSIIIGKNQNTLEEINYQYVTDKNIHVVRRVSGGGAVYHDFGNLNFSFITAHNPYNFNNFKGFTAPVIQLLHDLGLQAELKGRNDIEVEGQKISGTAQFSTGKRMISHGTLLFDTDLNEVARALQVKMSKIQSKGHKSVRSRVANISDFLDRTITISEFKQMVLDGLSAHDESFKHYQLTPEQWEKVYQFKAEKYDAWDWNYGKSPEFNLQRVRRFPIGEIDLRLLVDKGYISDIRVFGDFFGKEPIEDLEQKFKGIRYDKSEIDQLLSAIDIELYFGDISKEDLSDLIFGED